MLFTVLVTSDPSTPYQATGMVFDRLEAESYARMLRDSGYFTRIVEWRA